MDLDRIKQLQSLLEDRGKVLEKISSINSALGSLRTDSAAVEPVSPAITEQPQTTANPFFEQPTYNRLLQSLREMQAQIEERVRPLAEQVIDSEVAQLRQQSGQHQAALHACLEQIDQCIVNCANHLDIYQNQYASLTTLNERIAKLGGAPELLPDPILKQNLRELIEARMIELQERGKPGARTA